MMPVKYHYGLIQIVYTITIYIYEFKYIIFYYYKWGLIGVLSNY